MKLRVNSDIAPHRPCRSASGRIAAWCLLALWILPAAAQQGDPGRFEVLSATVELKQGVYYLDAWLEYRLSSEARDALEAGVPLTIEIVVEFLLNRRFWFDGTQAGLRQAYQLQFHALSQRYLVLNRNTGEQNSFANLFSALNFLGRVTDLPLIDATLLDPDERYDIRVRTVLSTEDFPGPLRLLTFWRRDWALRSEWYTWSLDE